MKIWSEKLTALWHMGALSVLFLLASCTIEPPLHLPQDDVRAEWPAVITDLEVIWDLEVDWNFEWWYGWDEEDVRRFGEISYPTPSSFEVRRYYTGGVAGGATVDYDGFTIYESSFSRRYNFGYYNLLVWSNIETSDATQTVYINEKDRENIYATTSSTRLSYQVPSAVRGAGTYNQPEIFYDGYESALYISSNFADYDYYDEANRVWVKRLKATLHPVVYLYLVQVIIYNNEGKIIDLSDDASLSGLADGVSLMTCATSETDANIVFPMRMKQDVVCPDGRKADILGGKLTTFGLCGMPAWSKARGAQYVGTRGDLKNIISLNFRFNTGTSSTMTFDLTEQVQRQAHGGVLTIVLDAAEITPPTPPTPPSGGENAGFDPVIQDYPDSVAFEFGI